MSLCKLGAWVFDSGENFKFRLRGLGSGVAGRCRCCAVGSYVLMLRAFVI